MKKIIYLLLTGGLTLTVGAQTNLIQNGSFAGGFTGWQTNGPASVKFILTTNTPDGSTGVIVSNRPSVNGSINYTLQQNIATALTNGANGRTYTTSYRLRPQTVPTSTRCALTLYYPTGSEKIILAEQVARTNGAWLTVRGTLPVTWSNGLTSAIFSIEVGQTGETNYPAFTVDDVRMDTDTDADGLPDFVETNTSPVLADTDADGLPDEWEIRNGFDPALTNERNGDPDGDGFTNFQEYWAATNPRDELSFPGRPANPNMSANARAVLRYLALLPSSGHGLVGQHVSNPGTPQNEFTNQVIGLYTNTGYWPGLVEFQYDDGTSPMQIPTVNPLARAWWTNGGILAIKFNPRNPWTGGPQSTTNNGFVDIPGLLDPVNNSTPANLATNLTANARFMGWLDEVAAGLAELQTNGVAVIYRTGAEMNGGWFWWGKRPQGHYQMLWRFMFDYFTHTKKLNHLIWTWEGDAGVHELSASDYFFPGADVVDVMSHNFYSDDWKQPFPSEQLYRDYGKVYAFPQAGPAQGGQRDGTFSNTLYADAITNRFPRCSWIGVWNSFTTGGGANHWHIAIVDNTNALALMQRPWSTTRDEVNWQTHVVASGGSIRMSGAMVDVRWQSGFLQSSTNLVNWTDVDRPAWPYLQSPAAAARGFWRVRE